MRHSSKAVAIALMLGMLAISGCSSSGSGSSSSNTVNVGVIVSLSGKSAPYGQSQKNGLTLAKDDINKANTIPGKKISLKFVDDQSDVHQSVSLIDQLINSDKVSTVIGPTSSTSDQTTGPIAQSTKVPVLYVSSSSTKGITSVGNYIWRCSLNDDQLVPQEVSAAQRKLGIRSAVLIYASDDASTTSAANAMKTAMASAGIHVLKTLTFASSDKDFSGQLTVAKGLHPDALFVSAVPEGGTGLLTQARSLGLSQPVIAGNGFNSPLIISGAGPAADGVFVGAAWSDQSSLPASTAFVQEYKARYGSKPDQFAAQAYAGAYIIANAAKIGGNSRSGILKGFKNTKDLPTVLGNFNFTQTRDADYSAVLLEVKGGSFTLAG